MGSYHCRLGCLIASCWWWKEYDAVAENEEGGARSPIGGAFPACPAAGLGISKTPDPQRSPHLIHSSITAPSIPPTPTSMAPKQRSQISSSAPPIPKPSSSSSSVASKSHSNSSSAQEILTSLWDSYVDKTPQRVKLIDVFMAFLVLVGGLQFVYCLVVGNYVSSSIIY